MSIASNAASIASGRRWGDFLASDRRSAAGASRAGRSCPCACQVGSNGVLALALSVRDYRLDVSLEERREFLERFERCGAEVDRELEKAIL